MDTLTDFIRRLLTAWGLEGPAKHAQLILLLLTAAAAILLTLIWKALKHVKKNHDQHVLERNLHPFFTKPEIEDAIRYYISTKGAEQARLKEGTTEQQPRPALPPGKELIPFFLKNALKPGTTQETEETTVNKDTPDRQVYLLEAEQGMGKTTFLINLYLKYISQWFDKEYDIKLMPMGKRDIDKEIDKITEKKRKNTILLLDAFDEDSKAVNDYQKRLEEILEKTRRFPIIIITGSGQSFPPDEWEGQKKTGVEPADTDIRKIHIAPFNEKDIKKYLDKRFPVFNIRKKKRARQLIKQSPDLAAQPLLLNYMADLTETKQQYENVSEIHEAILNKWLERESLRFPKEEPEDFQKRFFEFSRFLAMEMYKNQAFRKNFDLTNMARAKDYFNGMKSPNKEPTPRRGGRQYTATDYNREKAGEEVAERISRKKAGEFERLEYLDLNNQGLLEIGDLKSFRGIKFLHLERNYLTDITVLKELRRLRSLYLNNNRVSDVSALQGLNGLLVLNLASNRLTDIRPLRKLKNLEVLILENNDIRDTGPLTELKRLKNLYLKGNPVSLEQVGLLKQALPFCEINY